MVHKYGYPSLWKYKKTTNASITPCFFWYILPWSAWISLAGKWLHKWDFSKMWGFLLIFNNISILKVMKWRNHVLLSGQPEVTAGQYPVNAPCYNLSTVTECLCLLCGVLMSSYKRLCFPLFSCALRQGRCIGVAESCHSWEQQLQGVEKDKAMASSSLYGKKTQWSLRGRSVSFQRLLERTSFMFWRHKFSSTFYSWTVSLDCMVWRDSSHPLLSLYIVEKHLCLEIYLL